MSLCEFPGGTETGPSLISLKQDVIGKMTTAQLAEVFSDNCYDSLINIIRLTVNAILNIGKL